MFGTELNRNQRARPPEAQTRHEVTAAAQGAGYGMQSAAIPLTSIVAK